MPMMPPSKPKARAKRSTKSTARGNINIAPDATDPLADTPNPPTEPTPEPEVNFSPKPDRAARKGTLEARLTEAFAGAAIVPSFAGDQYSAFIIATRSQKFAHDLAELANRNDTLKKILNNILDGGAYGGVMFSGAALLLPIMWSYGLLPNPGIDPFSALYDPIPPGIVPRSAVRAQSSNSGRVAAPARGPSPAPSSPRAGAPVQPDTPPGVVTVPPHAHPPVSPAAGQ